ncbi:hypothetical protein DM860_013495 [Cuscuta australis]|uniref:Uncharacterized protein n=1 Tax=Cuscuta australis TaxID=267555 RepID=A0A328D020_9ASTE|nr:hypothetical protein DM860_013495 [Cuscuta australis]
MCRREKNGFNELMWSALPLLGTIHSPLTPKNHHKNQTPKEAPTRAFHFYPHLQPLGLVPQAAANTAKLAEEYGPVMRVQIAGRETTVIVSSADMAKEILHTHDAMFSDRSRPQIVQPGFPPSLPRPEENLSSEVVLQQHSNNTPAQEVARPSQRHAPEQPQRSAIDPY